MLGSDLDELAVGVVGVIKGVFGFAAQVFCYASEWLIWSYSLAWVVIVGEHHAGEIAYAVDGLFRLPETGGKQAGE